MELWRSLDQNDPEIRKGLARALLAQGTDLKHIGNKEENRDEILRKFEEGVDIWRNLDQSNVEVKEELIVLLADWAEILNEFELYDQEQEVRREREELLKSLPELALNK